MSGYGQSEVAKVVRKEYGEEGSTAATTKRRYWQQPRRRAQPRDRAGVASLFWSALPDGRNVSRHGWRQRHRGITIFLWSLIPVLFALSLYGADHPVLGHRFRADSVQHLLVEFGFLSLLALGATVPWTSRRTRSMSAALGIAAASALLVHTSRGLIEAHFLFLIGIALISLYQDWLPLTLAVVATVIHHMAVGVVDPASVYNHPAALAHPILWAFVHGLFVTGLVAAEVFHWRATDQQRAFTDRLTASANEGLIGLDESGHVTFVNPAAERLLGKKERLVKESAKRVFANRIPSLVDPSGAVACQRDGTVHSGRGVRFTGEDGQVCYVDWTSVPMVENDVVTGAVVTLRDVTERHLAESRLREQELQLSAAQRIARVGSFEWAPVADVLRVSDELVRMIDNARVERPPRFERIDDLLDCIHPEDQEAAREGLLRAHTHGVRFEVDCRIGTGEDIRYCELRGQLDERLDPEGPQRLVRGSCNDVTERVRGEEMRRHSLEKDQQIKFLREQDTFKNRFINNVAHELNTPLTPVRLQLHVLKMDREGTLTARQRRAVDMLDRNVRRFSGLVEDLLDTARIQGGKLRVDPRPIDLSAVVEEAVDHFEGVMLEKDLSLETRIESDLEVNGDHDRLLQVVYNLLSNACKFTPAGGTICIEAIRSGDEAVFQVRDDGVGISSEDQARLFQPFTQVQDQMASTDPGTGLGLYLCKGLVDLHQGRIWCESDGRGTGAAFGFALPVVAIQDVPVVEGCTSPDPVLMSLEDRERTISVQR